MRNKLVLITTITTLLITTIFYTTTNTNITLTNLLTNNNKFNVETVENVNNEQLIKTDEGLEYNVDLETPGDTYELAVDVVNNGTIDAVVNYIEVTGLTEQQEKFLDYVVTYEDGTEIKVGDIVEANTTKTVKVNVEFKKDITAEDLPTEDQELQLTVELNLIPLK